MPRSTDGRPLTIGTVLARLQDEFPDITISKIRFLEAEGLLDPARSPAGYRHYAPEDIERLEYILRCQRDQFWPLKVIKESLDALDRGLTPGPAQDPRPRAPRPTEDPDARLDPPARPMRPMRLTRSDLLAGSGADADFVDALVAAGLVKAGAGGHFDENDLRVVHAAQGLAAFGLESRHLRMFRTAADREVGLIDQAVTGRPSRTAGADRLEMARLCLQLHAALLKGGLGT